MSNRILTIARCLQGTVVAIFCVSVCILEVEAAIEPAEYLCEVGLKFYREGRYDDALSEFKKALLIQPHYAPAIKYIEIIQQQRSPLPKDHGIVAISGEAVLTPAKKNIAQDLELMEIQRAMISEKKPKALIPRQKAIALEQRVVIFLDKTLENMQQPILLEQGKKVFVSGKEISRFLVTEPSILSAQQNNNDELLLLGQDIGTTYLHIWDATGRWTILFQTIPAKPEGLTLEEEKLQEALRNNNFKMYYSMDYSSYATGHRTYSLDRTTYSYTHALRMEGETPYGDFDSALHVNVFPQKTEASHYAVGLSNGRYGSWQDFSIRGMDFFDFPPYFANLVFPGVTLRGVMVDSPAFSNRLRYTGFYGRENRAGYGSFSPALTKTKDAFVEGVNLDYSPLGKDTLRFMLARGHGQDREDALNPYGYDLGYSRILDKWKLGGELGYDSQRFGKLMNAYYGADRFSVGAEFRDINKEFVSITGNSWRQGEIGALLNLYASPTDSLTAYSSLDVFRDRLFPAEDNPERLNEDFTFNLNQRLNPTTSARFNYLLQNELGRLFQLRYQNINTGISKTLTFFKDINVSLDYYRQKNENISTPSSSYSNDRLYASARCNLIGDVYFYLAQEFNWLRETLSGVRTSPAALETGFDVSGQFAKSPMYHTFRVTYRNEEDTESGLSFLSGEDYVEGYAELSYRPTQETQRSQSNH